MNHASGGPLRSVRWLALLGIVLSLMTNLTATAQDDSWKTTVYPGSVLVTPGSCVDGTAVAPTVSVPSDSTDDGIFYTITQPDATGAYSLTAQVGDAYLMAETPGNGWVFKNTWNATYAGTAELPDCAVGPDQDTDTDDDADEDVGVLALPLDCGSIPYPAPTGEDVTSGVGFSNYVLTQNGVEHTSGPIELTSPDEVLTLSFDWDAATQISGGQYFVFEGPLDSNGNKVFTSATQWFPVWNYAGTNQAGCASVVGGDITVQFTNYVAGREGVGGTIDLFVELEAGSNTETRTIDFTFDDGSDFSITIPGVPSDSFGKRGWFLRDDQGLVENIAAIQWSFHVPASASGYTNLVLTDAAPEDGSWTFSCAGPSATDTTYSAFDTNGAPVTINFSEDCSAEAMTLSVAAVPANVSINFFFYADVTSEAEGPFYNLATASADEIETVTLPYEVRRTIGSGQADGDFVVTPIPPAITHAACVDEVNDTWIPASVTIPTDQEGVAYTFTPNPFPAEGGTLVVIATLDEGYTWSEETNGWVYDETNGTMVYEVEVTNDPCVIETPPPTETPTPPTPCIPPTPEECIPTPTPSGEGTPVPGGEVTPTPPPCETPTIPAECQTPTPPPVREFPNTGSEASGSVSSSLVISGLLVATTVVAAGAIAYRERMR